MSKSIGHRPLWSRCPKRKRERNLGQNFRKVVKKCQKSRGNQNIQNEEIKEQNGEFWKKVEKRK